MHTRTHINAHTHTKLVVAQLLVACRSSFEVLVGPILNTKTEIPFFIFVKKGSYAKMNPTPKRQKIAKFRLQTLAENLQSFPKHTYFF